MVPMGDMPRPTVPKKCARIGLNEKVSSEGVRQGNYKKTNRTMVKRGKQKQLKHYLGGTWTRVPTNSKERWQETHGGPRYLAKKKSDRQEKASGQNGNPFFFACVGAGLRKVPMRGHWLKRGQNKR